MRDQPKWITVTRFAVTTLIFAFLLGGLSYAGGAKTHVGFALVFYFTLVAVVRLSWRWARRRLRERRQPGPAPELDQL